MPKLEELLAMIVELLTLLTTCLKIFFFKTNSSLTVSITNFDSFQGKLLKFSCKKKLEE